jgi:hypothetical protein
MAVTAAAYKVPGKLFSNERSFAKFTYNFSTDTGAVDTYILGKLDDKCIITGSWVQVETACTSGDAATVKIGLKTKDDDCFMDTTSGAVANLIDDFVNQETAGQGIVCPADTNVEMVVGAHALTAGKINVIVEYMNIA